MTYRDLTGDDVLQAGDEYAVFDENRWEPIGVISIGKRIMVLEFEYYKFRRKLTPAEITAAQRVKFEAKAATEPLVTPTERYVIGDVIPFDRRVGEYQDCVTDLCWQYWCAATGCDPMGDV